MAKLYVQLIIDGERTFESVPAKQKEKVKLLLIEMERADLLPAETK